MADEQLIRIREDIELERHEFEKMAKSIANRVAVNDEEREMVEESLMERYTPSFM